MTRGCPFHPQTGGVSLSELGGVVRCGDRHRLNQAIEQLVKSLLRTEDLDEARGEALTFIAMVTAATLEMGAPRHMHMVQLEAARSLDRAESHEEIARLSTQIVMDVVGKLIDPDLSPSQLLIDRALEYLGRNYRRDLNDELVARELGLSTSHFRHLFREATGQPFRKYLMSLRLEKARAMLVEGDTPIGEIAVEVGFTGLAHFSRAFAQRFAATPSSMRRGGMAVSSGS